MAAPGFSPVQFNSFQLLGGLDLVTPTLSMKPGTARDSMNFEVSVTGGYSRIAGYERFDGRPAPSDAVFQGITLNTIGDISVGQTINTVGGASGVVIAINASSVYYTKASGTFNLSDVVRVGTTNKGTVTSTATPVVGQQSAVYLAAAADVYRADIGAVPGSGAVRGVAYFNGNLYAWRDNVGTSAMVLFKATTSGWTAITLGKELAFTAGSAVINDGDVVTGGTSGATGTVARVVLETGTWGGTPAATGRLILSATTGTFVAAELLKVATVAKATGSGAATQITLNAGGRVRTCSANFGGAQGNKLYVSDGVNRGYEFDGTTVVPIKTGMAADTPSCVMVHKNYLFFTFGPSLQFSALAKPYQWTAVLGAGELVVDDIITAVQILPGDQSTGALSIYTPTDTFILYGSSGSSFNLVAYNTGVGGTADTVQNMEDGYCLADRGVVSLTATKNYGNFDNDTLTLAVRPFIQAHRGRASCAGINREKAQYRVFYNDGFGLYVTVNNGNLMGCMPVYFPNPVMCWTEGPAGFQALGNPEASYFGSTNGYVYKLDAGNSCDGANMDFNLALNFNAIGNPRVLKRVRKGVLEVNSTGYVQCNVGYVLAYSDNTKVDQTPDASYTSPLGAAFWDKAVWDSFYWDNRTLAPVEIEMTGTAENVAIQIAGSSNLVSPFTVNTVTIHYSPRRTLR